METKRAEYINNQSIELVRLSRKRKNLHNRMFKELSDRQFKVVCADLDHTCMEIQKTEALMTIRAYFILKAKKEKLTDEQSGTLSGFY